MKHRQTPYDFRLEVLPISGGTFSALVRNGFGLDVGSLFEEYIAPTLYNTPKIFSSREPFTLVNVSCIHSGWSYGVMPTPPEEAQPKACTWLFTFAISHEVYDDTSVIQYSSLRWINTRVWGAKNSQFITIGIPHTQSQYLGLKYDMLTPKIAYFLVGALSKSFVRLHKYWQPMYKDYDRSYAALPPALVRSSMYMIPIYGLVSRIPYHLWVFNRHVWLNAPNLLSEKHITPHSLLYILMYVRGLANPTKRVEDKILNFLERSLLSTVQRAKGDQQIRPYALEDCLYTALMYRDEIPENKDAFEWLADKEQNIMGFGLDNVSNYRTYLRDLFYS